VNSWHRPIRVDSLNSVRPRCHSRTIGTLPKGTSFGRLRSHVFSGNLTRKKGDSGSKNYRNDRILGFFGQTLITKKKRRQQPLPSLLK
jgi:hypothetical protein